MKQLKILLILAIFLLFPLMAMTFSDFNWTNVSAAPPPADFAPAELLNNDAYCTSCDPKEQIIVQPWITSDLTPTINFTTNELATCAVMGNESGEANLNYTDMVAGAGVECSTTGGINHICTIQASNAFTLGQTKGIYAGCKDTEPTTNQFRNATFGVPISFYTFGTECTYSCIKPTAGAGLYLEDGCTIISN
jgi:hypothetical protein|tara:strand:- start:649 stop:1227 length:579 start_codon:yes stop_codon:yes gene_type:complete